MLLQLLLAEYRLHVRPVMVVVELSKQVLIDLEPGAHRTTLPDTPCCIFGQKRLPLASWGASSCCCGGDSWVNSALRIKKHLNLGVGEVDVQVPVGP